LREEEGGEYRAHAGDRLHERTDQADRVLLQVGRYGG